MALRTLTKTLFSPKQNPFLQTHYFSSAISQNPNPNTLLNLFQNYNFPSSNLPNFLKKNPFLLNSDISNTESSLKILSLLCPDANFLASIVFNCPRVLDFGFLKKWEMGFSKLGFKDNLVIFKNVLEVSRRFELYPDDVFRCIECLKGLRFSYGTITRVLEEYPMVITKSEKEIWEKVEFFLGLGIHRSKIDSLVYSYPGVLGFGVENKLKPLVCEFTDMGFRPNEIREEILRNPKVLGSEVGELSKCLRMLNSLKCRVPVKEKIFSEGAFRASYEVKLRVDCLHRHGLVYRDVFSILWREPRAILYDVKEIDEKIEFLVKEMKFDIGWLVDVPEYLGVNFEKQIVPRYNVIEHLRSRGGIGDEVGLRSLVKFSRLRFYNLYVKPYPECEKIYGRFADVKVRKGHPEGLWKLFKPTKYPDTKDDVKNIKSFMEQLC
ncbi:transcription termination factor [Artemisia annua]|uniref:Transcription termination factor n=1 Tax=Artemisia annua TaxID=35608 RepID=A0A2U1MCA6_ARTAN|nr:transcription termination factor [Artemisia annua]